MCSHMRLHGLITNPVPLIEKSRTSCPGGRFPPSPGEHDEHDGKGTDCYERLVCSKQIDNKLSKIPNHVFPSQT